MINGIFTILFLNDDIAAGMRPIGMIVLVQKIDKRIVGYNGVLF